MKTNRINSLNEKFNLLKENGITETIEILFFSEVEYLMKHGFTVQVNGKALGYTRKYICRVTIPVDFNSVI